MATEEPKLLPIGIQTFELMVESNYLYVDKTSKIFELIKGTPRYFLSRPRRFGKSLLISTLECVFRGRRELFKGLSIDKTNYTWGSYPIIRLDMSKIESENAEILRNDLSRSLFKMAKEEQIDLNPEDSPKNLFQDFITALNKKSGKKVVILIDEYDSPLVNQLHHSEIIQDLREILREFYRVTKTMDANLQFVFVTGVTNFAKANMFSGLNHLHNITLSGTYATLCGYTQDELEYYFSDRVKLLQDHFNKSFVALLADIKDWYNGYIFSSSAKSVYNPFSTLQFFADKQFSNYWYMIL